ncbi:putative secreted protein with PEP-CTERM sorting signal [Roseimicrobium gellanilyticum]|uniref:Putative secreted protein with PEP-CTERM sorting signal n=1 Tax=Roseimicrobium gellanilyticum TaxID=748857 RepID=A0A366HD26_9BACT|nr:autotransporter-associated beta strand repeat-containing protein [Roseimicrobium gellanilyticum]RBP39137.1 putative secreted protein with PEP-CTERM sorting signal [Roseimicrobium gellanilyticum]
MRLLTARRSSHSIIAAFLAAFLSGSVCADVLQWDTGIGTAGVQDGAGTWQVGSGNWLNQTTTTPDVTWSNGNDAVFGGGTGAAGTVTLGGPISAKSITFEPPGSGAYTITGDVLTIVDGLITVNSATAAINSVVAGGSGLTKMGAGTLTLGGTSANTYTGTASVNAGILLLNKTAGQNAITGNVNISGGGKLQFNADHQIADGAAVSVAGTSSVFNGTGVNQGVRNLNETIGSLTVVGGTVNSGAGSTGLVVTGVASFTGGTTSAIFVGNSAAQVSVNELRITGMNAVAGAAVDTANSFTLYGNNATTRSTLTVGSGGLFLDGSTLNLRQGASGTQGSRLVLNGDVTTLGTTSSRINLDTAGGTGGLVGVELSSTASAVSRTFNIGGGGANLAVSVGLVNGAATTASIVKTGAGTLTLSAANTYNGTTTVQQGALNLDGIAGSLAGTSAVTITGGASFRNGSATAATNNGVTNRINSAATLTLGGGTFTHAVAADGNSHNQTLASLTILQGGSTINANGITGTNTLTFTGAGGGGYVRQAFGTVNFAVPATGFTVTFANAPTSAGGSSVSTGPNSLLIGATLNGRDFIVAQAGALTAATYVPTGTTDWVTGANMDVTGTNPAPYAATNINSLRYNTAGAFTVTLTGTHTIDSGMILVTDQVGANASTLTGGTLRGSLNGELIVMQNNLGVAGMFTIGSNIENNGGATALTKAGLGILSLTGTNTYTGQTVITEGVLRAVDGVGLSSGSNLNIAGGLFAPGSSADFTRALGSGAGEVQLTGAVGGFTAVGNAANINLGGAGGTLQWGSAFFNPTVLTLNDANADNVLDFKNGIDLNGAVRTISTTAAAANTATISGIISNSTGTAGLIKIGTGTLILSGANTYGGTTTLTQGVLAAGHDSAFGTSTVLLNGGNLQAAGGARTVANNFVLSTNSTVSGANSLKVTGDFTFGADGNDITNSMTAAAVFELAGNVYLSNSQNSSFVAEFLGGGNTLISGVIANNSGNNALASHVFFNGAGTLRLTGVNTYTGRTLAAGGGAISISQDRNLGQAPASPVVDSIILANLGRLRIEESFTLDVNRSIGIGNSGGGAATGTIEVLPDKTFTVNGTVADRTVNPNGTATTGLPNVGSLTKTGNGVLVLGGNNTHSGTTTVSAGILRVASNTALGSTTGATVVSSGAHIELMNGVTVTGETITLNGSGRSVATPGSPDVNRGALQAAAGATATWAGNIILNSLTNSRIGAQQNGTLIVTGVIDDGAANNVLQIGADHVGGTVVLSGANTYGDGITATTEIARGTLRLGADNTLPTVTILDIHFSTNNTEQATVDMFGYDQTIALLRNTGNSNTFAALTNSNAYELSTLTINQNSNSTYGGVITGNVSVVKNGTGTLTLTRLNTYLGDTIINDGTIALTGGSALPDNAGSGDVVINGGSSVAGTLNLNNTNEVINGLEGGAGVVAGRVVNDTATVGLRTLTVGANGGDAVFTGNILDNSGTAGLVGTVGISKIGHGSQTLAGTNTFTGPVTAYNGNLVLDFSAGGTPINGQSLVFGNGTITFKGNTTGATNVSVGGVTLNSITSSKLVIDNNGGAGTTVTTNGVWASGSGTSSLFIDLSSGGILRTATALPTADGAATPPPANSVSIKNGIVMAGTSTGSANGYRGTILVKDATGIGFAMQDAGTLEIRRYTGATLLTAVSSQSGSANNYIMNTDVDHSAANFLFSTLQIDTGSTAVAGTSIDLNLGTRQLLTTTAFNGHALLVTGANDASITGTTAVLQNSLFVSNYSTGKFTIDINMNGMALVSNGPGLVVYNRASPVGDLYVENGVLRFSQAMNFNTGIQRILGGIFEIGADLNDTANGDFSRGVGAAAGQVALLGDGGFSAHGGSRLVSLGGDTPTNLVWGASNFLVSAAGGDANYTFKLGSAYSDSTLTFANAIDLGSRSRTIEVGNGVNANDVDARLTGVLSGAGGALEKTGTGTLEVTAANTYGMGTTIAAGKFLANNTTGSATGTGRVDVLSGATLGGTGTITASTGTRHITVNSGATLMVGSTHGVGAGGGGAASALSLQTSDGGIVTLGGTVQFDIFGNTNNGSGANPTTDNDVLRLTSATSVVIDGSLVLVDTTGAALSWALGSTWQLIDWANVSAGVHNSGTFDDFVLPTLAEGLAWDTSKIYTDGTISIGAVVPEPGRALLLMVGAITLVLRRRRSRM